MILPDWRVHDGTGPYLLLVHGFLSSRSQWMLNLDALGEVCRPVTVELFGHHESPSPENPDCYHPEYYVRAFEEIRALLGASRWFVLGYSLGAGLTLRYAVEYPERIIGHLFTNSTSGLADAATRAAYRAGAQAAAEKIRRGGLDAMARIPVHPRHGWRLPKPVYEALVTDANSHDANGVASTIEITNAAASMLERLNENVRPACLVWGTKERRFRPLAEIASASMPELSIVSMEAGHAMNMEAPPAFNSAVCGFVERCRKS